MFHNQILFLKFSLIDFGFIILVIQFKILIIWFIIHYLMQIFFSLFNINFKFLGFIINFILNFLSPFIIFLLITKFFIINLFYPPVIYDFIININSRLKLYYQQFINFQVIIIVHMKKSIIEAQKSNHSTHLLYIILITITFLNFLLKFDLMIKFIKKQI